MTTATRPAEGAARSPSAPAAPLLTMADLDDPEQYHVVRDVPILDEHDDPEHGPVDGGLLDELARNNNAMVERGDFPALILGHSRNKHTVVLIKGDSKVVYPGSDEIGQPPVVGHATRFRVADFRGRRCLYCDYHIHKNHLESTREYPYRSVERVSPATPDSDHPHVIDRIALLRSVPRRDLGSLHYGRDDLTGAGGTLRFCYARDFPAIGGDGESASPEPPAGDNPRTKAMATEAAPPPAADDATAQDQAPAPGARTIGEMTPDEFAEFFVGLLEHVSEPADDGGAEQPPAPAPAEGDRAQYAEDMGPEPDGDEEGQAPATERKDYDDGAVQAGGSNTFTPGACGIGKEKRSMYERNGGGVATPARNGSGATGANGNGNAGVTRRQYAKDQAEMAELLQYQFDQIVALQLDKRRTNYERRLDHLESDGYEIDAEARAELLAEIGAETPDGYEDRREAEIRKRYARRAVGVPMVPVGTAGFARHVPAGAPDVDETRKATAMAMSKGVGFAEALKLVRGA